MTSWAPVKLSPRGPVYVAIADALADDVRAGKLVPGTRLPTHRSLAETLGVNVVTVTRAYAEAARRGLVQGEVGRGTFVRFTPPDDTRRLVRAKRGRPRIDFEMGVPSAPPELLATQDYFTELAADPSGVHLETGYRTEGLEPHRRAAARWLSQAGLEADEERIMLTCGAQHALHVALGAQLEPGDTLLVAELTYPGVKALASILRLRLLPVRMDAYGLLPDALEDACRRANAKALYCMPNVQNPTGCLLDVERRRDIASLAERYDLALIEDDTSGFVCDPVIPPLSAFAPMRTTFVTSTSKSMAPGLRIGFLHAPDAGISERMFAQAGASSWMAPPLMAGLAARWIEDGTADALVAWKRASFLRRRAAFDARFGSDASPSPACSGYLWLPLPEPWRTGDVVRQAERRGIGLSPADFFVAGRAEAPHAVRLSLGRPETDALVDEGFDALREILEGAPEVGHGIV